MLSRKYQKTLAQKYNLIAISENNGRLTIVTSDPLNFYGIEDVRLVTGMNISVCLCEKAAIDRAIDYYYAKFKDCIPSRMPVWMMELI